MDAMEERICIAPSPNLIGGLARISLLAGQPISHGQNRRLVMSRKLPNVFGIERQIFAVDPDVECVGVGRRARSPFHIPVPVGARL